MKIIKEFLREEDGLGTVEIVLLIAVLVGLALLFRRQVVKFVSGILEKTLSNGDEFNSDAIGNE